MKLACNPPELSPPPIRAPLRRQLEAKIVAGERIGAPEIRRARGPLPSGRPRRQSDRQPHMAA
jgi:hypothetical protein